MQCPTCHAENLPDSRFCTECGSRIESRCSACGSGNPPSAKFCRKCGAALSNADSMTRPASATAVAANGSREDALLGRLSSGEPIDFDHAIEEFEHCLIDGAMRKSRGNKQAAARLLRLKRTTLVAKLRRRNPSIVDD